MDRIELLAPAGSIEALNAAIGEGADAIYLGLRDFNARQRAKNFSYKQFEAIIDKIHHLGKRIYLTLNTVVEENELDRIYNLLKYINSVKPDAVIIQDIGVLNIINTFFPEINIHASTQMNVSSFEGVNFLSKNRIKRVVLSRELNFEQIKEIRKNTYCQLEVFVHGALCVSLSGACLFSSYFGGKSANRGRCTQACRRAYKIPGENKEKYLFSLNDLSLIEYIPELEEIGINSIKLEGRMKSYQYIATVVKAYRYMIDNYKNNLEDALEKSKLILQNDFAREKTTFLFLDRNNSDIININRSGQTGIFIGNVESYQTTENSAIIQFGKKHKLQQNDLIRIQSKRDLYRYPSRVLMVKDEKTIEITFDNEKKISINDEVYLTNKNIFEKKYASILPNNLDKYKKHPGIEKIPYFSKDYSKYYEKEYTKENHKEYKENYKDPPEEKSKELINNSSKKHKKKAFFEPGIYVKINRSSDLFILQSEKPKKVIFHINRYNFNEFISNLKKTSFKEDDIILYLEPYFDHIEAEYFNEEIEKIKNLGFNSFVVNNLGQLNILKKYDVNIIIGPYLYIFNSYAIDFYKKNKINNFIFPIESNKRNINKILEKISKTTPPTTFFITVFSYPELFQIISRLDNHFKNNLIEDSITKYNFFVNYGKDKISLIPEIPFSITDKINDLKRKGIENFIIDLSFTKLNKELYKEIFYKAQNSQLMENTERFNWKDGFYSDQNIDKNKKEEANEE